MEKKVKELKTTDLSNGQYDFELRLKTILPGPDVTIIKALEKEFPEMTGQFKEFLLDEYITFCKKQHDYGPTNIAVSQRLETDQEIIISLKGLWFRMNDKIQRLFSLVLKRDSLSAANESVEDSFKDVSVYGKIARVVMSKVEIGKDENGNPIYVSKWGR